MQNTIRSLLFLGTFLFIALICSLIMNPQNSMFWGLCIILPILMLGLHIRIAFALWIEMCVREAQKQKSYLGLGAWFWAICGLVFGLLGLAVFRFVDTK